MLSHGWDVRSVQENDRWCWSDLASNAPADVDFVLWTRTGWDYDHLLGPGGDKMVKAWQHQFLRLCRLHGIPTVGFHLDRFFGLDREHILEEPFFSCALLITADGANDDGWAKKGINHLWFLPGVSRPECEPGTPREALRSRLAFVGSWQGHYHKEHQHRFDLVGWLRKNFRNQCEFYPRIGHEAVRGEALRDLYASVDVAVGDSCFSGDGVGRYSSDRIPESIGRGAFLLHPNTPGVTDGITTPAGEAWQAGVHLRCWDAGDWDGLGSAIEWALSHSDERKEIAATGRAFTIQNHTYETRMRQMVEAMETRGLL